MKQFLILSLALVGTFVVTAVAALYVASKFTNWAEPFVGPVSAAAVIGVSFWLAPQRKRLCGMIALLLGTAAAWVRDDAGPSRGDEH